MFGQFTYDDEPLVQLGFLLVAEMGFEKTREALSAILRSDTTNDAMFDPDGTQRFACALRS